jgi:hypothetical protein
VSSFMQRCTILPHCVPPRTAGNYDEYFGMATDVEAVVYLMLVGDVPPAAVPLLAPLHRCCKEPAASRNRFRLGLKSSSGMPLRTRAHALCSRHLHTSPRF